MDIDVVILHNQESERFEGINIFIEMINKFFSEGNRIKISQIYLQREFEPITIYKWFIYNLNVILYFLKMLHKSNYGLLNTKNTLYAILNNMNLRYLHSKNNGIHNLKNRIAYLSEVLTDKHLAAIRKSYENKSEILIVAESDVIVVNRSHNLLEDLMKKISNSKSLNDNFVYIDLAGGSEIEMIQRGRTKIIDFQLGEQFEVNFVNTTCCYMLNRKIIEFIVRNEKILMRYKSIGPETLFNQIDTIQRGFEKNLTKFYHQNPTIFMHGSRNNYYKTTFKS
jgi:hypothetical protein